MVEPTHSAGEEAGLERSGLVQVGDARVGDRAQAIMITSPHQLTSSCQWVTQIMWWVFPVRKKALPITKFLLTFWGKKIHT